MDLRGMQLRDAYDKLVTTGVNGLEDGESNFNALIANNGGTKLANYALDLAANNTYNLSSIFSIDYGTIRLFVGGTNASFSGHLDSNGTIQEFGYTNDIGLAQGANKYNLYHNGTDFIIQNNTSAFRSAILVAMHV